MDQWELIEGSLCTRFNRKSKLNKIERRLYLTGPIVVIAQQNAIDPHIWWNFPMQTVHHT